MLSLRTLTSALCLALPATAISQRHGRADSVANYQHRQENLAILTIRVEADRTWRYLDQKALAGLTRQTITFFAPRNGQLMRYEGFPVKALLPKSDKPQEFSVFRVNHWGFRDKLAYSSSKSDSMDNGIVADTLNGRKLPGSDGYSFVATLSSGQPVVINDMAFLQFK